MKTLSPREIAEQYAIAYSGSGCAYSIPGVTSGALIDVIESAIIDALDTRDDKYLASELKRVEGDRDGWMKAYLDRGDRHRAIVEAKDREIGELHTKLNAMTTACDHAIEAAHLVHERP